MSINVDNNVKNQKTTPALYSDIFANIPAFGQTGRLFFATDTNTIYRDTGSAWVVFIVNSGTIPSGLTPIGAAYTVLGVNAAGTGLEYKVLSGASGSPISVVAAAFQYQIGISLANTSTNGYLSSTDWNTFNAKIGGSGTINNIAKFSAAGTVANSTITDDGTNVATISNFRIGTTPGSTYKLEIDGGINIAATHEYRKVGVSIFNTTNNNIPKFSTTTNTYTNSNILDTGTVISLNSTTLINTTTDNNSGAKLQVIGNISFQNVFNRKTASYTLVLADQNDIIEMNVATANNLTIPLNSAVAFPIGTEIAITQYGAGKTTIVATGGVTLRSAGGLLSIGAQYAMVTCVKVATDEWYIIGSLIA